MDDPPEECYLGSKTIKLRVDFLQDIIYLPWRSLQKIFQYHCATMIGFQSAYGKDNSKSGMDYIIAKKKFTAPPYRWIIHTHTMTSDLLWPMRCERSDAGHFRAEASRTKAKFAMLFLSN